MALRALPLVAALLVSFAAAQARAGLPAEGSGEGRLRELADRKGLSLGAAVMSDQLDDPEFVQLLLANCNYLTPENELKWSLVHPSKDQYDFTGADKIVDFARKHGMTVRGHTLAWHNQNPSWLADSFKSKEQFLGLLKAHIQTVVGRYRGKIRDWDVLNEAVGDDGKIRDNLWHYATGPEYMELALRWAREADPKARLFINDYGIEEKNAKSDLLHRLAKDFKDRGVPLDGIGMQFHVDGQYPPDWGSVAENVKRFEELGLAVQVTELDVRLQTPVKESALAQQARIFAEAAKLALAFRGKTYVMWGLSDRHSWIPTTYPGFGAALMFDEKSRPKPAYHAVREVLSKPDPGPKVFDRYRAKAEGERPLPPFRAFRATRAPVVDGKISPGEWDRAVAYPYLYNQLSSTDLRPPGPQKDIRGRWRLLYEGDTLYGLVERWDDVTDVTSPNPWDNDCVEIFFSIDGQWKQYRTIVGQDWQVDNEVPGKAVWSKDGERLEFSVKMPVDLTGKTIGWNTALADNDEPGGAVRKCQLYPVIGNNTGWQGRGFAELTFEDAQGRFADGPRAGAVPPFQAAHVDPDRAPAIDGRDDDPSWKEAPIYPFGFNQLSASDQSQPDEKTLAGDWRVLSSGGTLYGLVHRSDDRTVTDSPEPAMNDHVEIAFIAGGRRASFLTVVGRDFEKSSSGNKARAVWSKDGKVLEFTIEASRSDLAGQEIRWSIGLFDNDRGKEAGPEIALFPFCGDRLTPRRVGTEEAREFGVLQLP